MCCGASSFALSFVHDRNLFEELERMVEEDRRVHAASDAEAGSAARVDDVHRRNGQRLKEIIAQHGWPGRSLVGEEGAIYAWMILQHLTDDSEFQRKGLELVKQAASKGESPMSHVAYLEDVIRISRGEPQLYGTQFELDQEGLMSPLPVEDPAHMNERRSAVGLDRIEERVRVIRDQAALVGSGPHSSK